jgi:hypothetical protein
MRKVTTRKYGGNDACSWAIFIDGRVVAGLTGLNRGQASYYRTQVRERLAREAGEQSLSTPTWLSARLATALGKPQPMISAAAVAAPER